MVLTYIKHVCITLLVFLYSSSILANTDVRILVDISGSMKQNDPNNLRQPAIELLIDLLPDDSKAGIWSFGEYVNMLVKHDVVNEDWRKKAKAELGNIYNLGQRTHLVEVLQKAAFDFDYSTYQSGTQFILLTDGMVDISKKEQENELERDRILTQLLPLFAKKEAVLHTIALSTVRICVLEQMALKTSGVADIAYNADDLMPIFLRALDSFQEQPRLPINDNVFLVDERVQEITALIFHDSQSVVLQAPSSKKLDRFAIDDNVNWKATEQYDLITIKRPEAGNWKIDGQLGPLSRISVLSDLNLEVTPLSNNVFDMDLPQIKAWLLSEEALVKDDNFLNLLNVDLKIDGPDQSIVVDMQKQNAQFISPRADQLEHGVYSFNVYVDGQTFKREYVQSVSVRPLFSAQVTPQEGSYLLDVYKNDQSLDDQKVELSVTLKQDTNSDVQPITNIGPGHWQIEINDRWQQGEYLLKVNANYQRPFQVVKNQPLFEQTLSFPISQAQRFKIDQPVTSQSPSGLDLPANPELLPESTIPTQTETEFEVVIGEMPVITAKVDLQATTDATETKVEQMPSAQPNTSEPMVQEKSTAQSSQEESLDSSTALPKPPQKPEVVDESLSLTAIIIATSAGITVLLAAFFVYRWAENKTLNHPDDNQPDQAAADLSEQTEPSRCLRTGFGSS